MISVGALERLLALNSATSSLASTPFNATLPISVQVLSQLSPESLVSPLRYEITLGNQTLQTKSAQPLDVGAHYWGELSTTKEGMIKLSSLIPKPPIFNHPTLHALPLMTSETLTTLLNDPQPEEKIKTQLLELMAQTESKSTFLFYTSLLYGLSQGFVSLAIEDRQKKRGLIQYRIRKKGEDLNTFMVEFASFLPNLGPVGGIIHWVGSAMSLTLRVTYDTTASFLQGHVQELDGFTNFSIVKESDIKELYPLHDKLLNLQA